MRNFKLEIAGYGIGFEASADGPELTVSKRFLRYLNNSPGRDILIKVHSGSYNLPEDAGRVFHSPLVEDIDGKPVESSPDFWSVWKDSSYLYIITSFPLSHEKGKGVLKFSMSENVWHLWTESRNDHVDPMEYPLDGLILYYLTTITGDIFIHAAGIRLNNHGFLFTGTSGKGKSTMASLWRKHGADIIHDDRLIIRKSGNEFLMYNTPVYENEYPQEARVSRIFVIEHGIENHRQLLRDSSALSQVMSNCIQHSWDGAILSGLLTSVSALCSGTTVYRLFFKPDVSVIDYLLNDHE